MNDADVFRPFESPIISGWGASCSFCDLPDEILEKVRARLRFIALTFSWFCVAAIALEALTGTEATRVLFGVYAVNGLASVGMYALCRSSGGSHRRVLQLGLVYEVVLCLVVSIGFPWADFRQFGVVYAITWTSIMIVAFPLLIPSPPVQTLIAALAAASTAPIGLAILRFSGAIVADGRDFFIASTTPVFCMALAYASSRVVYGLNVDVARAQEMGSYRLVEQLGSGGMGDVWRAEHKMLARPAAVKLIGAQTFAAAGASGPALRRFEREAQATALLESQHTIEIYDFGVTQEGSFYYAMELLNGLDLERLVNEFGPVQPERVVHILASTCHSLAEAHERGLIHRDIKPTNIYLCRKGLEFDFVKVLDFGLVKAAMEATDETKGLTAHGNILGTPAFLAPEMAMGDGEIDGRADLYALGCVAYWLLTGAQVFEADTPVGLAVHHVQTEPVRLSQRTEIEIPGALEDLVHACLAKDPAARPQSASELTERLISVPLPAPWTHERAEGWWRMHLPESVSEVPPAYPSDPSGEPG